MANLSEICSLICKAEMKMGLTLRHEYLQNVCVLEQYFDAHTCIMYLQQMVHAVILLQVC